MCGAGEGRAYMRNAKCRMMKGDAMEQIVLNQLMNDGMCQVKLLSDTPVRPARMLRFVPTPALDFAEVNCYDTAALSLFYGEVTWPARDAVDIHLPGWPKARRVVVWKIMPGERMSEAIVAAYLQYSMLFGRMPNFAFTKQLPKTVEHGHEVFGVMLLESDWAIRGCLMVGG